MGRKWRERQAKKANNRGGPTRSQPQPKSNPKFLFTAYGQGKKQEHSFVEVFEAFCNWCQAELPRGGDIAASLREGQRIDLVALKPKMSVSTATDAATKE